MRDMEGSPWAAENWIRLLDAIGIISGLFFTAITLHSDTKSRQIANLLTITTNHRQVWKEFYLRPELSRVMDPSADPAKQAVTPAEEEFVNFVTLHLSSVYYAMHNEMVVNVERSRRVVGSFFSLPIPRSIWEKTKQFQNRDFVEFVEKCRSGRSL